MFPEHNTFGIPRISADTVNVTALAHKLAKKYNIHPRVTRYLPEGCIEENYKLSEDLWYIHYLRKWVLNQNSFTLDKEFKAVTSLLDNMTFSIKDLDLDNRKKFFGQNQLSSYCKKLVEELLNSGSTKEREFLEKQAQISI